MTWRMLPTTAAATVACSLLLLGIAVGPSTKETTMSSTLAAPDTPAPSAADAIRPFQFRASRLTDAPGD